ncbi:pyridoxal-phosphate dependent enzyme [Streptosporangium soli]|nr:pyridoxal-phosphate dependent enzyme [Streptosporangium sp. KLBMP 9127]
MTRAWVAEAMARLAAEEAGCEVTPLREFPLPTRVRLLIKDESAHPTGSMRHRHARALFRHAVASGRIVEGTTVVEAAGGNAAVAQAHFARLLGLRYVVVMPGTRTAARAAAVQELGGECRFHTPPAAIYEEARRLAGELGGHYLDQFAWADRAVDWQDPGLAGELLDDGHPAGRREPPHDGPPHDWGPADDGIAVGRSAGGLSGGRGSGPGGAPAWVVVGASTGATSAALGRRARLLGLSTKVAVADPENSAYFPGWTLGAADYATGMPSRIEGIGRPRVEPGFAYPLVDMVVPVKDAASVAAARHLRAVTGLPVGGSSGTTLWAAIELIARMHTRGETGTVIAVLGDAAPRHLRTYHDDEWTTGRSLDLTPHSDALARFVSDAVWTV